MNTIKFSFIVPFYNVEKYIEQCIRSLYSQDIPLSDYEVIAVDDSSPDGSAYIIERLQKEFSTLQLWKLPRNLKQGGARNYGLKKARGKYVWFVDSDDYIEPNILNRLLIQMKNKELDILHFDYKRIFQNGKVESYRISYDDEGIYTGEVFFRDENKEIWWKRCVEVWRKIYRKDFLTENHLFFEENVMYEDTDWSIDVFLKAKRVMHINESPYRYRENPRSVTQSKVIPIILSYKIKLLNRCVGKMPIIVDPKIRSRLKEYISYLISDVKAQIVLFDRTEKERLRKCISDKEFNILCRSSNLKNFFAIKCCFLFV